MFNDVLLRLEDRTESESIALQDKILAKIESKYKSYSLKKLMSAFDGKLDKYYKTQEQRETLQKLYGGKDTTVIKLQIKEHKLLIKYEVLRIYIRQKTEYFKKALEV